MPTFEITITAPDTMQNPVDVHQLVMQMCTPYLAVQKVVKVTKEPYILNVHNRDGFDHLFTDTQALVDAVRYDSTPGSFEDSVQRQSVDNQLHDSVVRLEGAVTQLKRALEEALRAVK